MSSYWLVVVFLHLFSLADWWYCGHLCFHCRNVGAGIYSSSEERCRVEQHSALISESFTATAAFLTKFNVAVIELKCSVKIMRWMFYFNGHAYWLFWRMTHRGLIQSIDGIFTRGFPLTWKSNPPALRGSVVMVTFTELLCSKLVQRVSWEMGKRRSEPHHHVASSSLVSKATTVSFTVDLCSRKGEFFCLSLSCQVYVVVERWTSVGNWVFRVSRIKLVAYPSDPEGQIFRKLLQIQDAAWDKQRHGRKAPPALHTFGEFSKTEITILCLIINFECEA